MAAGGSYQAARSYRERWLVAPSPRSNVVNPMFFVAPQSDQPDRPCVRCEARGDCRHRVFA